MLLAHDAFEAVTDRLEAALTQSGNAKRYALRGSQTSELVGAMREFETGRLPSSVLADFIRLRSHVAAINHRLGEVYESEERLHGTDKEMKRAERYGCLASAVRTREDASRIYESLKGMAIAKYAAENLVLNTPPAIAGYSKEQS